MNYTQKTCIVLTAFVVCLTIVGAASAQGGPSGNSPWVKEAVGVSNLQQVGSGDLINGATIMVRDIANDVISAEIMTADLEPDTAYSIWVVVFNFPEYCATPYECGSADLLHLGGDERVRSSIFWGGGILSDAFGYGHTTLRLMPGRTARELFPSAEQTTNFGIKSVEAAEIHLVIRTHGLAGVAGTVADQIGTATLACPPEMCANKFFSIHRVN